jgi:hypothetical protein
MVAEMAVVFEKAGNRRKAKKVLDENEVLF